MTLKNYIYALFITFPILISAQINVQWEARYNNSPANAVDQVKSMSIDFAGSVYTTGTSFNGTNFDAVLVKCDATGAQQWIHTYNGAFNGFDDVIDIAQDGAGNTYICGITQVTATDYDIFVRKINYLTGAVVWNYIFPGTANYDICNDIKIDNAGNVVVAGGTAASTTDYNFAVFKVSGAAGTLTWQQSFNSTGTDRDVAKALVIDPSNNIFVAGETAGVGALNYYVRKYNSAGATLLSTEVDGYTQNDSPDEIVLDGLGNVIVTGNSFRSIIEEEDVFTVKLDAATLSLAWKVAYSGSNQDIDNGYDVTVDALNNIYVAARTKGLGTAEDFTIIRYRPNGTQHWVYRYPTVGNIYDEANTVTVNSNFDVFAGGYTYGVTSNNDFLTLKLDTLGVQAWNTTFNGPANNSDQSVKSIFDANGNIFVAGTSKGAGTNKDFSTIKYCQYTTQAGSDAAICIGGTTALNGIGTGNFVWGDVSGTPIVSAGFSCTTCNNPTISPTTTSTYTLASTNALGCVDLDTITIVVNPLPGPVITTSGAATLCANDSITLTSSVASSYSWSNGDLTQSTTVQTGGIYTITVIDAQGCANSTDTTITVYPVPTVSLGADVQICSGTSATLSPSGGLTYLWNSGYGISNLTASTQSVGPLNAYTYIVEGTNSFGCTDMDTIVVNILPLPLIILDADIAVCPTFPVSFTASGATSYVWNAGAGITNLTSPSQNFTPTVSAQYVVTGTAFNGCIDTDTINVSVGTDSAPITVSINFTTTTITASSGVNIEWYHDGIATGITTISIDYSVLPLTAAGTYYVVYTNVANGCIFQSNTVEPTLAIQENDAISGVKIFPNPTSNSITVAFDATGETNTDVTLMDATGKIVFTTQITTATVQIDLSAFSTGIYTLSLKNKESGRVVRRRIQKI